MRPFDPRLLRYARATRGLLIGLGLLAVVQAAVAIALAGLIAFTVTAVFESGETLAGLTVPLGALLAVVAGVVVDDAQLDTRAGQTAHTLRE